MPGAGRTTWGPSGVQYLTSYSLSRGEGRCPAPWGAALPPSGPNQADLGHPPDCATRRAWAPPGTSVAICRCSLPRGSCGPASRPPPGLAQGCSSARLLRAVAEPWGPHPCSKRRPAMPPLQPSDRSCHACSKRLSAWLAQRSPTATSRGARRSDSGLVSQTHGGRAHSSGGPPAGLVLLNSAGQIQPGWRPPPEGSPAEKARAPPPRLLVEVRPAPSAASGEAAECRAPACRGMNQTTVPLYRQDQRATSCWAERVFCENTNAVLTGGDQHWITWSRLRSCSLGRRCSEHAGSSASAHDDNSGAPGVPPQGLSRGLFLFLERSISWNLARLYPGAPLTPCSALPPPLAASTEMEPRALFAPRAAPYCAQGAWRG